jgi:hypothetical protein
MAHTLQQLAQSRPGNTNAASVYSPSSGQEILIKSIIISNTTASSAKFRIFHDDDGSTYDETTSLYWDIEVPPNTSANIEMNIMMNVDAGNLAIRTDTASALTFSLYGSIIT